MAERETAGWNELGLRRYTRYAEAFDHAHRAVMRRHFLEAIAIFDSLITDRLASRAGYLTGKPQPASATTGRLCNLLVGTDGVGGAETDDELRTTIAKIQQWAKRRNEALHATAKILRGDQPQLAFRDVLAAHRPNALAGDELLREFDARDTILRKKVKRTPATFPHAFRLDRPAAKAKRGKPELK